MSNLGLLIHASFLEIINIACSIISIATRTLASIFNGGYSPDPEYLTMPELVEGSGLRAMNAEDFSQFLGLFESVDVQSEENPASLTPEKIDTALYLLTTDFI